MIFTAVSVNDLTQGEEKPLKTSVTRNWFLAVLKELLKLSFTVQCLLLLEDFLKYYRVGHSFIYKIYHVKSLFLLSVVGSACL